MSGQSTSLRPRRRVKLSGFGGLDVTTPPACVGAAHATDGKNFLSVGGVLRKRRGWRQAFPKLPERPNGVFVVPHGEEHTLLVYAGTTFYLLVGGVWEKVKVRNTVGGLTETLTDRRILGFAGGEYLYLVGAGIYLRYGCFNGAWEIRTVDPYVPTTTVGISPVGSGDSLRVTKEGVNLLTPIRKNTLFGGKSGSTWVLDGAISTSVALEARATVLRDGALTEVVFTNRPAEGGTKLYAPDGVAAGNVEFDEGRISLAQDTTPAGDSPNITVTFAGAGGFFGEMSEAGRWLLHSARFGCLFGVGGATDRLFLAGARGKENVLFFSAAGDFSYFPDQNTVTLGTDAGAVTAMLRLADGRLAVFKEEGRGTEPTVYDLTGAYRYTYDEDGNLLRSLPVFSIGTGALGECAISQWTVAELGGEGVLLSRHGVFSVEQIKDVATDVRRLSERGYGIRDALAACDLTDAVMWTFGGSLYLSLGEAAFVTDARTLHTDAAGGRSYAWWRLEHFPARVFFEWEGEMYFGSGDGRLCAVESEGFRDVIYDETSEGELGFDFLRGRMVYSHTLEDRIRAGARLTIHSERVFARLLEGAMKVEGTRIYTFSYQSTTLREWEEVYADFVEEGAALSRGVPYYIVDPDPSVGCFSLSATPGGEPILLTGVDEDIMLYLSLTERPLCIRDVRPTAHSFALAFSDESEILSLVNYFLPDPESGEEESVVPLDPVGRIEDATEVEAVWVTPPLDFGEGTREKTLLSLSVMGRGCFFVGAESATHRGETQIHLGDGCSIAEADAAHVSLTSGVGEAATVRAPIGRFGTVCLSVRSLEGACEILALDAVARIKNEKKGVL